jgi:hypothetical protein
VERQAGQQPVEAAQPGGDLVARGAVAAQGAAAGEGVVDVGRHRVDEGHLAAGQGGERGTDVAADEPAVHRLLL